MSRNYDVRNMLLALEETASAIQQGKMPFGAVLADGEGTVICRAHNQCEASAVRGGSTTTGSDVTRHAEMELVRKFTGGTTGVTLSGAERAQCTLYTSTEPCVMCAGAIYWSGVGRVVYGCSAAQLETLSGPGGFDIPVRVLYGMASEGARKMEVEGPLLSDESLELHEKSGVWKKAAP
jgi:tRNA(Arg) A34 adenosine deaminase TadA